MVVIGTISSLKLAALQGGAHAPLALQAVLVLPIATDLIAFGNDLGRLQHRHVHFGLHRHQLVVDGVELIHVLVLHQADRFNAATDGDIDTIQHDRSGRNRNRLQARSALPVDCGSCHGDRQSRADRALAGDIHHHGALLHRAAHHDVLDFVRRNVGALDRLCDHMPRHGRPLGIIEGAAISLADGRAGRGYDYCFSHLSPLSWSKLTIRSVLLRIAQYVIGGITELDIEGRYPLEIVTDVELIAHTHAAMKPHRLFGDELGRVADFRFGGRHRPACYPSMAPESRAHRLAELNVLF